MGVKIYGKDEPNPYEGLSYDERRLRERQERRARLDEHHQRQQEFLAQQGKALGGAPEDKMLRPGAADATKGVDLSGLSKDELRELAAGREVEVTREDGRTDLEPTVADYIRALGG